MGDAMDDGGDVLVGLRFEVSGGLGRMSGCIVGKAGALYLVQKLGAEHLELLALDDLRSAKFYRDGLAEGSPNLTEPAGPGPEPAAGATEPGRRRLADQIRKRLGGGS